MKSTACIVLAACLFIAGAFSPTSAEVIISEIMYNPNSAEVLPVQTEWLELYNTGAAAVDLSNWYLSDEDGSSGLIAAGTSIAPGEAIVIVPVDVAIADFQAAWGTGFQVLQVSNWGQPGLSGLANSPSATNEILTLRDSGGIVVDEVNYDDSSPWPSDSPDGPSIWLQLGALDAVANDNGANWARSEIGLGGARANNATDVFAGNDVGSPGAVVPEPASLTVLGAGLVLAAVRRRKG